MKTVRICLLAIMFVCCLIAPVRCEDLKLVKQVYIGRFALNCAQWEKGMNEQLLAGLEQVPENAQAVVIGTADNSGPDEFNQKLSKLRAETAAEELGKIRPDIKTTEVKGLIYSQEKINFRMAVIRFYLPASEVVDNQKLLGVIEKGERELKDKINNLPKVIGESMKRFSWFGSALAFIILLLIALVILVIVLLRRKNEKAVIDDKTAAELISSDTAVIGDLRKEAANAIQEQKGALSELLTPLGQKNDELVAKIDDAKKRTIIALDAASREISTASEAGLSQMKTELAELRKTMQNFGEKPYRVVLLTATHDRREYSVKIEQRSDARWHYDRDYFRSASGAPIYRDNIGPLLKSFEDLVKNPDFADQLNRAIAEGVVTVKEK